MTPLSFERLNVGWNAEPNAPATRVAVDGQRLGVRFYLNCFAFDCAHEEQEGVLSFTGCSRWRLGSTNDEGWLRGQCRYSHVAPAWGEFYELHGDDPARDIPTDWRVTGADQPTARHFLFYFRDHTFECMADDWSFERL